MPKTNSSRSAPDAYSESSKTAAPPRFPRHSTLLQRLADRERGAVRRQARLLADKHGRVFVLHWNRLTCVLATLAPHALQVVAPTGVQFFIPDGKYRMQVFALHCLPASATSEPVIAVYLPDVLAAALAAGLLTRHSGPAMPISDPPSDFEDDNAPCNREVYGVGRKSHLTLTIDSLDHHSPNPQPVFTNMTGWNRKAIRITLAGDAPDAQVATVEQLCVLAADAWAATCALTRALAAQPPTPTGST